MREHQLAISMIDRIGPKHPFRHYIRERMALRGVDQARLASMMDSTEATISKLLNGKMHLNDKYLAHIAYILGCSVADLFIDPSRPDPKDLLAQVPADKRQQLLDFVAFLKTAN
jgi:transcriptional regulator with XRE-family HTH domain